MLSLSPPEFLGAKICFWIAGLAALIWWLTYDAKPHVTLDKFASARKKYILLHWGGALYDNRAGNDSNILGTAALNALGVGGA